MKKNAFKLCFISVFGLLNSVGSFAQQDFTLYNMEVVPQRMYANPAFFPSYSKVNIGLPVLSSDYVSFTNSGFKYSDLVQHQGDSLSVNVNNMLSKLAKNNYINSSVRIDLLSFGFVAKEKNYFSFNVTEKVDINFMYTKGLMQFLADGNGAPGVIGQQQDISLGLNATHYREYGLGYSRKINDKWTVGGKVKYLYGMENVSTGQSSASIYTDPNSFAITAKSNIDINTSGVSSNAFTGFDPVNYAFKKKNNGAGLDLGGTYKLDDKWSFSASVIDLGFITWNDSTNQSYQSHTTNQNFTFRGVDVNNTNNLTQNIGDSLKNAFKIDSVHKKYTTFLPTQIYLGGNYNLTEKTKAGLLLYGQFFDGTLHPAASVSFSQRFGRWFNYSLSYSAYNRSYNNVGLGIALNLGPIQIYTVSDNLLGAIFPQNTQNLHVHFGINMTFGRKLDKDKDGISDKKDKCPDVAGLKQFEGCPDSDHDKVPDKDDMCPTDSGSVALKGCPDRDGDKIIDLSDSCPDAAGLLEFNGCPDKDGDKIIDKKDECPDQPGSIEMKGCPDKDGDKVRDKDDACPDVPGPESNKGCPETTLHLINSSDVMLQGAAIRKDGTFAFDYLPADSLAVFKLTDANDSIKARSELTVVVNGAKRSVFKDSTGGLYRFKIEKPKPAQEVAVKLDAKEAEVLKKAFDNLEFNSGKDIIKPQSLSSLEELAKLMAKKPGWHLKISGHTDNVGNANANMILSKKRAEAVKKYLVSKGVAADRFKVEWFGGTKPIASNKTEAGRQKNRRVEMLITE